MTKNKHKQANTFFTSLQHKKDFLHQPTARQIAQQFQFERKLQKLKIKSSINSHLLPIALLICLTYSNQAQASREKDCLTKRYQRKAENGEYFEAQALATSSTERHDYNCLSYTQVDEFMKQCGYYPLWPDQVIVSTHNEIIHGCIGKKSYTAFEDNHLSIFVDPHESHEIKKCLTAPLRECNYSSPLVDLINTTLFTSFVSMIAIVICGCAYGIGRDIKDKRREMTNNRQQQENRLDNNAENTNNRASGTTLRRRNFGSN